MALPTLHPFVIVSSGGSRFKVIYADKTHAKVVGVEQQIVPMRGSLYWRPINPTSKAAAAAVLVAARKQRAAKEKPE
jgi:hypothetical protein